MKVTLYEHAGFTGRTKGFTVNTPSVGSDFNDLTSSIRIEQLPSGKVVIYQHNNYGGARQELNVGNYDMKSLSIGHAGFTGRTKSFIENTPSVGSDFNDLTSSIRIVKLP